jgi:hypothetical protein
MDHTLIFKPDGSAVCLWHEAIPLHELGWLIMERASTIEFNEGCQQWQVKDNRGKVCFSSTSRTVCLTWEHQNLQPTG